MDTRRFTKITNNHLIYCKFPLPKWHGRENNLGSLWVGTQAALPWNHAFAKSGIYSPLVVQVKTCIDPLSQTTQSAWQNISTWEILKLNRCTNTERNAQPFLSYVRQEARLAPQVTLMRTHRCVSRRITKTWHLCRPHPKRRHRTVLAKISRSMWRLLRVCARKRFIPKLLMAENFRFCNQDQVQLLMKLQLFSNPQASQTQQQTKIPENYWKYWSFSWS